MFRYDFGMNMCSSAAKTVAVSSSRTEKECDGTKNGAFAVFIGAAIAVPFFVLSGILSISSAVLLLLGLLLILRVGIAKCRRMESF